MPPKNKKRKKPSLRKKLLKQLDDITRAIVRMRDKNCVTCGVHREQSMMNLSHKVTRKNYSTRWDLRNCNLQCVRCHRSWHDGFTDPYNDYINKTYGDGTVQALETLGHKPAVEVGLKKDFQLEELLNRLEDHYKALKKENEGWSWK